MNVPFVTLLVVVCRLKHVFTNSVHGTACSLVDKNPTTMNIQTTSKPLLTLIVLSMSQK
jgi:hypothetical protein